MRTNPTTTIGFSKDRGWSWYRFTTKPDVTSRETLKTAGWRWSNRRQAWYHTGGAPDPCFSHSTAPTTNPSISDADQSYVVLNQKGEMVRIYTRGKVHTETGRRFVSHYIENKDCDHVKMQAEVAAIRAKTPLECLPKWNKLAPVTEHVRREAYRSMCTRLANWAARRWQPTFTGQEMKAWLARTPRTEQCEDGIAAS